MERTVVAFALGLALIAAVAPGLNPPVAHAQDELSPKGAQAELQRLRVELGKLAGKTAWTGVDRTYERMSELSVTYRLGPLTYEDHLLGIQAADAMGQPNLTLARIDRARVVKDSQELLDRKAMLYALFGPVRIKLRGPGDAPELQAKYVDFLDPANRNVLDAVKKSLTDDGRYEGLLPHGVYTLNDASFDIVGATEPVQVKARRVRKGQ